MIPVLETERLTLRAPVPGDLKAYAAFLETDRSMGIGGPKSYGEAWRAFAGIIGHWAMRNCGMWVYTFKGEMEPIGLSGHWYPGDWPEREIGWHVWRQEHEGKGLAYEAASRVVNHTFHTLGWPTLVSYILTNNHRSIALAERLGAMRDDTAERPRDDVIVYRHPRPA